MDDSNSFQKTKSSSSIRTSSKLDGFFVSADDATEPPKQENVDRKSRIKRVASGTFDSDSFESEMSKERLSGEIAEHLLNEYDDLQFDFENFSIFDLAGSSFGKRIFELSQRFDKAKAAARNKYISLQKKTVQEPKLVKLTDKICFVLGVGIIVLTSFILGRMPQWIPYWYTLLSAILLPLRFYYYRQQLWHYFMFDFCYFANFLLLLFIYVFPDSKELFFVCFSFAMGPVAGAIIVWRNSLVFHSVEKVTSIFIHFMPLVVCFVLRFQLKEEKFAHCRTESASFYDLTIFPVFPYLVWQALYFVKTEIISVKKIRDKNYMTSLRWLSSEKSHGFYKAWITKYPGKGVFVLMGLQLVYHIVVSLPVKLLFDNYYLCIGYVFVVFMFSIWNGAGFYFEVFSKDYMKKMAALEQLSSAAETRAADKAADKAAENKAAENKTAENKAAENKAVESKDAETKKPHAS